MVAARHQASIGKMAYRHVTMRWCLPCDGISLAQYRQGVRCMLSSAAPEQRLEHLDIGLHGLPRGFGRQHLAIKGQCCRIENHQKESHRRCIQLQRVNPRIGRL